MARTVTYVYGKCINRDYKESGNPCPLCESKERQKVINGHDFVCRECGEPLHKVQAPKTFWQKYGKLITALIALAAVAGIVFGVISLIKNRPEKPAVAEPAPVEQSEMKVAEEPAVKENIAEPVKEKAVTEAPKAEVASQPKPAASSGISTKDFGYAKYRGRLKNGQMNDEQATLTFRESHLIDSRDPQQRYADPGDYVIGEFVEGHLVQGIWYDSANNVKQSIIIGR